MVTVVRILGLFVAAWGLWWSVACCWRRVVVSVLCGVSMCRCFLLSIVGKFGELLLGTKNRLIVLLFFVGNVGFENSGFDFERSQLNIFIKYDYFLYYVNFE